MRPLQLERRGRLLELLDVGLKRHARITDALPWHLHTSLLGEVCHLLLKLLDVQGERVTARD